MPLTTADFADFNPATVATELRSFDDNARRRGAAYFNQGRVRKLECLKPGRSYLAHVQGSFNYEVTLNYDAKEDEWLDTCSCPLEFGCKHSYAALQQLLVEHAEANVQALSSSTIHRSLLAGPAAPPPPPSLKAVVETALGRSLTRVEIEYVNSVQALYRGANTSHVVLLRELAKFGLPEKVGWWEKAEMWVNFPETELEFWNCLANFLDEHGVTPPPFLKCVTDLEEIRKRMQQHRRAKHIAYWAERLAHLPSVIARHENASVKLRVRLLEDYAQLEWRLADGNWTELKARKLDEFDARHGHQFLDEAALIWQPFLNHAQGQYDITLGYARMEAVRLLGRWLRQPALRSFFVNAAGEPLTFHEAPLRWNVTEPTADGGDYSVSLVRADGSPAPKAQGILEGHPSLYLTAEGVFTGPPPQRHLLTLDKPTLIPAKAFETNGGLRLIEQMQSEPPPRLAAQIRTVPLQPRVVAELRTPWAGSGTEYCHVDLLGVSADGRHVERWHPQTWLRADELADKSTREGKALERIDRFALEALPACVGATALKWDYSFSRWATRVTKKFPELFVPFLKSLPPGTTIELRGELAAFQNADVAGRIRLEATEAGQDWFDLRVLVDVTDTTLTPEEIKLLLDAKGKWVRLGAKGWKKMEFALSEEEDKELARLGLTPHELTSEPQRMHALQLADKAARKFLPEETCDRIERRAAELQARVTPDVPAGIKAELRPYQRDGFHFLAYLSTNRFGGILADDMGLGKTVQTLAWLEWLRETRSAECGVRNEELPANAATNPEPETRNPQPSLVVCPKSVADNWHAEAERFLPGLKVKAWSAGELKNLPKSLGDADLHVINYNQLRTVGDKLAGAQFLAVILDEGQYIKNPTSLTGQIARRLRAEHRLILSGTPIENRLLDLWSLMSFAMPGALGSRAEFGRLYDAKGDPFARQRLSARVRPFLIRRTKSQVARDLPDRVEEDLFCELEGEQKTLYRAELKRAQAMLLGVQTVAALNKERFNFLTSLLRLRQICCHPKLVKPNSKGASAKVEALFETLEPLMEEGQKVLVFSQFVELLDLLQVEVQARGWKQWYLAGATENRGDLVRDFQAAEGGGVFLISLKAGGFGLNLTASSYVILFDPWWNPAVENQAIDRTHRIGQTQKVIAYRLLIKNSIEEKIRALQKQKKGLADDVLGEEKFSQGLNLDDLRYLLAD